jgi:ATP-binding cassette subfamily B protein
MKKFLSLITNNNIGALRRPLIFQLLQSILQGQPYFVILMVILELIKPIENPGQALGSLALVKLMGWLALSLLLLFLFGRAAYNTENIAAYSLACEGRLALGEHLRRLPMGFFKGRDPGDITALMLQDYGNIETMMSHLLMDALGSVALPLVFLLFLIPLDWRMSLITIALIPFALLLAYGSRALVNWLGRKHIRAKNEASSRMLEYLDGMKNIKSYNLQGKKFARLEKAFLELKDRSIRLEAASGPSVIFGVLALQSGIALIMLAGTRFVLEGSLSIASFFFFLIVGTRMYDPLSKVLINFVELSYYSISADRIGEVFDTKPLPEPEKSTPMAGHGIEFRNVSFSYKDKEILKNIRFRIPENSITALVGPSGAGKTTITNLIARFWDVQSGEILVGGRPVAAYRTEDLLAKISMVFQDVYLFSDTIFNNIKVGRADATEEEVMEAARKAHCHHFISELPEGYGTMVGEGGSTLSGGEKQRISIARAILKNAPIVLLDEATASLDPENEHYIQSAIGALIEGRTIIVIAHRLSTITLADQILVIKEGQIAERGTHEELIATEDGLYAQMWAEQRKAHLWKVRSAAQ